MNLELLLTQISNINKKHEEILKSSGEKFNIFNLLDLSDDEISHSRIIASLLNPKGMHEKGNKFIKLFLNCVGINDFSIKNVITEREKYIGPISEDYCKGGIIDIILTDDKNQQIFIENKIYANDQRNQLLRYNEHNPEAHLLYLTLHGNDPSEYSIGKGSEFKYEIISYKKHILKWLELCKKESIDNPLLYATLTQYIVLIKQLTGQARSKEMQKEYLDTILKNADNVSAAFIISQDINEIKLKILETKFKPLINVLANKLDLEVIIDKKNCDEKYWGFSFEKPEWKNKIKIRFEFEKDNSKGLIYGLCSKGISKDLNSYLQDQNYKRSKAWPLYKYMDKYKNWDKEFYLELYSDSDTISNVFESKTKEILSIVETKEYEL